MMMMMPSTYTVKANVSSDSMLSNPGLEQEIENGTFRSDLFYRINVVNLHLPPLRERASDVPDLVDYFLQYHNRKYNCRAKPLSPEMMAVPFVP